MLPLRLDEVRKGQLSGKRRLPIQGDRGFGDGETLCQLPCVTLQRRDGKMELTELFSSGRGRDLSTLALRMRQTDGGQPRQPGGRLGGRLSRKVGKL